MADKYNLIRVEFTSDKVPNFVEVRGKEYIKYGETNDYPQYLVLLFNRSAKHNAIITNKQLYIKGQGWIFSPENMQGDDQIALRSFIDSPNPYETLDDLMAKTCLDVELFNGCYLKVTRAKGKRKTPYISHVDYCKVRSNADNTKFYLSDEWITKDGTENFRPTFKTYPAYKEDGTAAESIYYYKAYRPNLDTYTLPDYIGAVPAIITDAEIANFHRAEIQNSFKGSKMIVFKNGEPSEEDKSSIEKRMKKTFSPTDKAGSYVITYVDDESRVPEVIDLSAGDFADKYNALNDTIQQEIFVGHKVTSPMLFGVRVEGQLGGRNEMIDAFTLFQNTYISPRQKVQENIYNIFAPVKGKLKIKPLEPLMPEFSEQTLMMVLTKDEIREVMGREPLTPEQDEQVTPQAMSCQHFNKDADDEIDFNVFMKYGESIEQFTSVKHKKFMFTKQDFALTKIEQGVLDLIKKTPDITKESIGEVMRLDKTSVLNALETLAADGLIETKDGGQIVTSKGEKAKVPSFESLFIRYRYALRPDAPALIGENRDFCKAMMDNPRYFSREEIEMIGEELGQIYGIPNYDAFTRRGGWYHDPNRNVNVPFCRHIWQQELVKKR